MVPILDEFIEAYKGKVNRGFWKYIYKYYKTYGSGGQVTINGWILNFIPYLASKKSPYAARPICDIIKQIDHTEQGVMSLATLQACSTGLNLTPVTCKLSKETHHFKLISGFAGATLTSDGYVMP